MVTFERRIRIDAPVDHVWETLADIGTIAAWNPGVFRSHVTTEQSEGVGAGRHCDLGRKNYLDEEVVEWEPPRRITFRIIGTNLPFQSADIRFTLAADGRATQVTVAPDYTLKFGPVGSLLDLLFVRRTYRKGMDALLVGLKRHVEERTASVRAE